jgi:hypothetical protein
MIKSLDTFNFPAFIHGDFQTKSHRIHYQYRGNGTDRRLDAVCVSGNVYQIINRFNVSERLVNVELFGCTLNPIGALVRPHLHVVFPFPTPRTLFSRLDNEKKMTQLLFGSREVTVDLLP